MSDIPDAELAIVGAGPVGLYAAYYAGFRGLRTVVVEALPMVGGQIATFYPDSLIFDVPGFSEILGRDLVDRLVRQAGQFSPTYRLAERVIGIDEGPDPSSLALRTLRFTNAPAPVGPPEPITASAVLLTTGIGSFSPQTIKAPGIARFAGAGLEYQGFPADRAAGRRVLVVGGSQAAVDTALGLAKAAASVTLIHRRDRLAVTATTRARLEESGVRFLAFRELSGLDGGSCVERATLVDRRDGREEGIGVDLVVPCYGFVADPGAVAQFGVAHEGSAVRVDSRMASSRPRIFAAGDGAVYPGKVRVLAADLGEACTAVNNVAAVVIPGAPIFPGYSSHSGGSPRRPRSESPGGRVPRPRIGC